MRSDSSPNTGHPDQPDQELTRLDERFALGDLTPKCYARLRQHALAALGRRRIAPRLGPGEAVVAEHHWVEGHARLPDSPFAETGQIAGSLFATDRRLFRWRFHDGGSSPAPSGIDVAGTVEYLSYEEIAGVQRRSSFRWGEAVTGAVIAIVAGLMYARLAVTGPVLLGVGVFGIVHAMIVPTRYVMVAVDGGGAGWPVWAARTRSGRAMLGEVARRLKRAEAPADG